jgi:hypothetical protein
LSRSNFDVMTIIAYFTYAAFKILILIQVKKKDLGFGLRFKFLIRIRNQNSMSKKQRSSVKRDNSIGKDKQSTKRSWKQTLKSPSSMNTGCKWKLLQWRNEITLLTNCLWFLKDDKRESWEWLFCILKNTNCETK